MWTAKLLVVFALACLVHTRLANADINSCTGRCMDPLDNAYSCQCNSVCETYGDCCVDFLAICLPEQSCNIRCGEAYNGANLCHCNDICKDYSNCCEDYDNYCLGTVPEQSCNIRCGEAYNSANPCHCNDLCKDYNNCCEDYDNYCLGTGSPPVGGGGGDMSTLAQSLWDNDVNRIDGADLVFNKQALLADYSQRNDLSTEPLFSYVNEARLTGTWPAFMALLDNYNRFTGTADTIPAAEDTEIESFLDDIFATSVMDLTTTFMIDNGYFTTQASFRSYLKDIWFTLYTRSGGTIDSSGFEHTFVGEVKNGKVSGYHNWLTFYEDEKAGNVNYYGYTSDNEPNQVLMQFRLDEGATYWKELASIIYGASPEFELAIFTSCFVTNPNAITTFTLNGFTQNVQTWDYTGGYIGSTYFAV